MKISAGYHAGNITYKWLNGYTYEIKYTTYTTNYSPDGYCEIDSVCFGDGTNGSLKRINGPQTICGPVAHDGVPISSVIRWNEYVTTHTYPGPGNYTICFEQPNRNPGIITIPNSVNHTMYLEAQLQIPTFTSGKNDSPTFANHAVANGCMNNGCFTYNPMATDADGDSLSYELAPCAGSFGMLTPGYSYPSAGAGGTFSMDPATGLLTWCKPQLAGDYNVVIKIKEWRKNDDGEYFMIGYVNRDTQFTIDACTGMSDVFEKEQSIALYPNPAADQIEIKFGHVSSETYTIELTDVSGKTLACLLNNSAVQSSIKFDLKEFSNGLYFIKITGNTKTSIKKLVKQ